MNTDGCPEGYFTDSVIDNKNNATAFCQCSVVAWFSLVPLLLIIHMITAASAFVKWYRRERKRNRMHAATIRLIKRDNYFFKRRLPLLPTFFSLVTTTAFIFWISTTVNAANAQNGLTFVLFSLHVLAVFLLLHFYVFRFVRIGLRMTPLTKKLQQTSPPASSAAFALPKDTNGLDLPLKIGFTLSASISLLGFLVGLFGGLFSSDKNHVAVMCGVLFGLGGVLVILMFMWQVQRNIAAVHALRRPGQAQREVDKTLRVLRQQRKISCVIMLIMTSLSFLLAFTSRRPWWLLVLTDTVIVFHTLLLWLNDFCLVKCRSGRQQRKQQLVMRDAEAVIPTHNNMQADNPHLHPNSPKTATAFARNEFVVVFGGDDDGDATKKPVLASTTPTRQNNKPSPASKVLPAAVNTTLYSSSHHASHPISTAAAAVASGTTVLVPGYDQAWQEGFHWRRWTCIDEEDVAEERRMFALEYRKWALGRTSTSSRMNAAVMNKKTARREPSW